MKSPLFSFALVIVIIYCKTSFFLFGSIIVYTLTKITKPALASMDTSYRFLILDLRAIFVRISANNVFNSSPVLHSSETSNKPLAQRIS